MSQSLPESTVNRIKKIFFRILDLPEEGLEYAEVHVGKWVHDIVIKVKTELADDRQEIVDLKDRLFAADRFKADAINENSATHQFIITPPEQIKPEIEEIYKLTHAEEGVIGKEHTINQLLDKIEDKI